MLLSLKPVGFCLLLPSLLLVVAHGQEIPSGWVTYHPNQEVRVRFLPSLMARSHEWPDILLTSLDIVFHDRSICCGKDSVLEDRPTSAGPLALQEVATASQGKFALPDGGTVQIQAGFVPASEPNVGYRILEALKKKQPLLMVWNSHLYVLYGAVFDEALLSDGTTAYVIHKLQLLDPRFSDSRRKVIFNRQTDDWSKVQGLLLLSVTRS